MKKILVPTDFSVFGDMAVDAAFLLAKKISAYVHVTHVADLPENWESWALKSREKDVINKYRADELKSKLQNILNRGKAEGIDIEVSFSAGRLIKRIIEKVEDLMPDLIIMGSHGVSGKEEFFIGSHTQKVVRKIHVPILVLKQPVDSFNMEVAVFATALFDKEKESFLKFKEFLLPLGLKKIHLLAIDLSSYFSQPSIVMSEGLKLFAKLAEPIPVETHFYRDYSVEAGIRNFSESVNADIIGISNHGRRPLKRMLQGSNVEMLVNHSNLPVLCIDFLQSSDK